MSTCKAQLDPLFAGLNFVTHGCCDKVQFSSGGPGTVCEDELTRVIIQSVADLPSNVASRCAHMILFSNVLLTSCV